MLIILDEPTFTRTFNNSGLVRRGMLLEQLEQAAGSCVEYEERVRGIILRLRPTFYPS
jgi:hypothetical protein